MRSREQHLGVLVCCASVVLRGSTRRKQAHPAPTTTHSSPSISQARPATTWTHLGILGSLLFSNPREVSAFASPSTVDRPQNVRRPRAGVECFPRACAFAHDPLAPPRHRAVSMFARSTNRA